MAPNSHTALKKSFSEAQRLHGLGAFWALDPGYHEADPSLPRDQSVPSLAGVPFGVKDLFDQLGLPTTAGLTGDFEPATSDAEAVRKLRAAGAVPIGKTAMDQLACTTGAYAPGFPLCLNPINPEWSPGGSSSGSAVAVAAGILPFALGTDTAGSCRVPAAYCGVVGFKPANERISARGCVPVMPGFDQPGLLARSVADCLRAYRVLDPATISAPKQNHADADRGDEGEGEGPLRLGLLEDLFADSDRAVAKICRERLERAAEGGGGSGSPRLQLHLTRLDWSAPGFGVALARSLTRTWGERVEREPGRFNEVISSTIEFGRSLDDQAEERALTGFALARRRLRRRYRDYDAVVCPTVPIACPDREDEGVTVSTAFTRTFNALGWPAISIPAGEDGEGRPVGLQIATPPTRVSSLFAVAGALEQLPG